MPIYNALNNMKNSRRRYVFKYKHFFQKRMFAVNKMLCQRNQHHLSLKDRRSVMFRYTKYIT